MEARLEPVPGIEEGGRLFVRGPNVMLGYYRAENPGVLEPPAGGWHDTGDIVTIDARGLHQHQGPRQALRQDRRRDGVAVGRRGAGRRAVAERAVASSSPAGCAQGRAARAADAGEERRRAKRFLRHAKLKGAPELIVPADIMIVDAVPLLGSGKPDYVARRRKGAHVATACRPPPRPGEAAEHS